MTKENTCNTEVIYYEAGWSASTTDWMKKGLAGVAKNLTEEWQEASGVGGFFGGETYVRPRNYRRGQNETIECIYELTGHYVNIYVKAHKAKQDKRDGNEFMHAALVEAAPIIADIGKNINNY